MEFEPSGRRDCISATLDSKVFVWGGDPDNDLELATDLKEVYILDTFREKWQSRCAVGDHPRGCIRPGSAQSGNVLYLYGGLDVDGNCTGSLFSLNLDLLSWRELSPHVHNGPRKKYGSGMVIHGDKIVLYGGSSKEDGRTNELHLFDLSTGLWSSQVMTGSIPPPSVGFAFVKVNDSTVMFFGGNNDSGCNNDLYALDINNMHWTEIPHKSGVPWPEKRSTYAATVIGANTNHAQLVISGGVDMDRRVRDDMWLLDVTSMTWRKTLETEKQYHRYNHVMATATVVDEFCEVILFGGDDYLTDDYDVINWTEIIRFEKHDHLSSSDPSSFVEWKITDVADYSKLGRKDRLQYKKDLLDKGYERSCRKVVEDQLSVLIYIARINFVGLPRSGKSSTLRRLIGNFLNLMKANLEAEIPSTGVAERNQAFIRKISKCFGFISKSQWSSTDLAGETGVLNQFLHQLAKDATAVQVKVEPITTSHHSLESDKPQPSFNKEVSSATLRNEALVSQPDRVQQADRVRSPVNDIEEIFSSFQEAMDKEDWDTIKYLLEDTMYLINTDTGGQTEFLDLMSRFLMGPALNLIISRLTDSLDQVYKIYCTNKDGVSTEEEDSTVTLEEVIFQALASIACMETSYDSDQISNDSEKGDDVHIPASASKAMFVGTFKDKVSDEEFEEKDKILRKKIEQTEFYSKRIVVYASDKHLILPLDNLKGGQEEVDMMRETFEDAITKNFKKVRIPATWLMLSINMRHTGKRTMTLTECRDIAGKLGIAAAKLTKVLWFLHYRVGILLYYPEVDGFDQIIILDIQVVFDVATQLIKKTFTFKNVEKQAADNFKEKAQFTMSDLQEATKNNRDALIPLEKMVGLMEHHKILAALPLKDNETEPTYFMPCVLKNATCAELQEVPSSPDIAPLMIRYECGYIPLGIFSSLIIGLVSQEDWELVEEDLYRNRIEFQVGDDGDSVTLISRPTFIEVVLVESDPMNPTSSVCGVVRNTVESILEDVHSYMKYSSSTRFQYGFECPHHPGKEHLCVLKKLTSNKLFCLQNRKKHAVLPMKDMKYRVWFHQTENESTAKKSPEAASVSSTPSLSISSLTCLKWTDKNGQAQILRIQKQISPEWVEAGDLLGLTTDRLKGIDMQRRGDVSMCCRDVLLDWLDDNQGNYPATWEGVVQLLKDMEHSAIAQQLQNALL